MFSHQHCNDYLFFCFDLTAKFYYLISSWSSWTSAQFRNWLIMGSVLQAELASEIAQWQYLVALYRLSKEAHSPSSKSRINKHTRALSLLKKNLQIILCWLFWWYWWWCLQAERGVPDRQSVAEWWKPGARESLCNCTHRSTYNVIIITYFWQKIVFILDMGIAQTANINIFYCAFLSQWGPSTFLSIFQRVIAEVK